jgi:hypothetical protein
MRITIVLSVAIAVLPAQNAAVVPPGLPPASHPAFLLNQKTADPLVARYPWYPQPLYYGGPETVGPLGVDWVWPDVALVDWNRDGRLDPIDWDHDGKTDPIAAGEGGWLYFYKHR